MPLAFAFVPDGKRAQSELGSMMKLNSCGKCSVAKELNRARVAYECISIHCESGDRYVDGSASGALMMRFLNAQPSGFFFLMISV